MQCKVWETNVLKPYKRQNIFMSNDYNTDSVFEGSCSPNPTWRPWTQVKRFATQFFCIRSMSKYAGDAEYLPKVFQYRNVLPLQNFVPECLGGANISWNERQNRKSKFPWLFLTPCSEPCGQRRMFLQIVNCPQIAAITAFVANSTEYDLVLLQDLWMRPDHETIRASLPKVTRIEVSESETSFCRTEWWPERGT